MRSRVFAGICLLFFPVILLTGCSHQNYATVPEKKQHDSIGSGITPNGEKVGWEDIKRLPR